MNISRKFEKPVQNLLGFILMFQALNAFGGGIYGMMGAKEIPLEWLKGSPFSDYFFPGLFLFLVLGGFSLFAGIKVFRRSPHARIFSTWVGWLTIAWISVQVSIIGLVSWLQPVYFLFGILIIFLSRIRFSN